MREPVIYFFDGVCGLCSNSVDFLMARDKNRVLRFAPLQGETAKRLLSKADTEDLNSMVLYDNGEIYRKSDAILKSSLALGGFWSLAGVLFIVPRFVRDAVYDVVARNRYKWFGKKETCRLPTKDERAFFLD